MNGNGPSDRAAHDDRANESLAQRGDAKPALVIELPLETAPRAYIVAGSADQECALALWLRTSDAGRGLADQVRRVLAEMEARCIEYEAADLLPRETAT